MEKKTPFKVVIVGGSIAGLTLAHCLDRYGIDYVVLEKHGSVAPQVGASVSLMPNGARILDQLGMFDTIFEGIVPCVFMQTWTADGKLLSETDSPILTGQRLGYTITFLERERLLQILYEFLSDKSKVLTSKSVKFVEQTSNGVIAHCEDGSKFSGDVLAGADGVHSVIRGEMRKQIASEGTDKDLEALKKDVNALSAEYSCLFGISKAIPGLEIGHTHRSCGEGASTLLFGGPGGKLYWFLFTKNDERKFGNDIPRYSKSDQTDHVAKFLYHHVSDKVLFSQVWKNRIVANFVPIEEMENEHWVWNRVACVGDSIHKMTPNLGQGANCAIESAADLANSLAKLVNSNNGKKPLAKEVQNALLEYHQRRHQRANLIVKAANKFTRVEALATRGDWLASMYILPRLGDILADRGAKVQIGATKIDCLPMPKRALEGTMPWSINSGIGKEENRKRRAHLALPLVLLALAFIWISRPFMLQQGRIIDVVRKFIQEGHVPADLVTTYFGWEPIDKFITKTTAPLLLLGSPFEMKMEMINSMARTLPIIVIWTIESFRRGNALSFANLFPTLFLLLTRIFGTGPIVPLYCFFHYYQSPQENFAALDNRLTNMNFAKSFLPALLLVLLGPTAAILRETSPEMEMKIYGIFWLLCPLYLAVILRVSKFLLKDTTRLDRLYKPTADLPYLRITYIVSALVCASLHIYNHAVLKSSFFESIKEEIEGSVQLITREPESVGDMLSLGQLATYAAMIYWLILSFGDLKFAGRLQKGWFSILIGFIFSSVLLGLDAAVLIMWAWREEIMATKQQMAA